jgi:hypothetical protein
VSKGRNDKIRFISELRNKQVTPDLFTERFGLKRYNLHVILSKQVMKVNPRRMVKDESTT